MATRSRSFRSGITTVNVNVPRTRSTTRRAKSRGTARPSKVRTIRQVAATPSRRSDNTPLYVGATALAAGALYLLWPREAPAAPREPIPNQIPGTVPGPTFQQIAGASVGYAGPGMYRYVGTEGLNIRPAPLAGGTPLATVPPGTVVQVTGDAGNGWLQVSTPVGGFMCASCADLRTDRGPGGTWLVRQS